MERPNLEEWAKGRWPADEWRECARYALALEADRDRLRREKGEALELLGTEGGGGAAAGLIPAIHNLAHERDRYKQQAEELAEALYERNSSARNTPTSREQKDSGEETGV